MSMNEWVRRHLLGMLFSSLIYIAMVQNLEFLKSQLFVGMNIIQRGRSYIFENDFKKNINKEGNKLWNLALILKLLSLISGVINANVGMQTKIHIRAMLVYLALQI